MTTITVPAAKVRQGNMVLYTTSLSVKQLISEDFYSIKKLDAAKRGYQRVLDAARTKRLANYVVAGQKERDVLLPTSIFLATDKDVRFDESKNTIEIDTDITCPFNVVDGQHRLEGLKMAADKDDRVLDFEVPVNIVVHMDEIVQMCHFLLVNTTQKPVSEAIGQAIRSRLSEMLKTTNTPTLPAWIEKRVETGDEAKAYRYVQYLNDTDGSPWKGKIAMANESTRGKFTKQESFVKAVTKHVLSATNPMSRYDTSEVEGILLNYWKAISNILDDGETPSVIYKFNGVHLFSVFSTPLFLKLEAQGGRGNFTVEALQEALQTCFENMQGEHAGVGSPDYWHVGSIASRHNQTAMTPIYKEMVTSLHAKGE